MMRYTPYSEAEIQSMGVMDEGVYPFQVLEVIVTDKYNAPLRDKNGIDMAKLKLLVWDKDSRERTLYTFISGDGNFAYKLRHFAKTLGMLADYENGSFDIERTQGKEGFANLVIKKGTLKNDGSGEMWADRNDVKDFVDAPVPGQAQASPSTQPVAQPNDLDDQIPF
jgi:hypothetical protein